MHADRNVDPEERALLREIVHASELDAETQEDVIASAHESPALERLEERLTHPVLRELLLALAWELTIIDGRVTRDEARSYDEVARRLGIAPDRARAIRRI